MKPKKSLVWKFFPWLLLIIAGSLLSVSLFASHALKDMYYRQTENALEIRAILLQEVLYHALLSRDDAQVDRLSKQIGRKIQTRITVILPAGKVIGDSEEDPASMDNHRTREEVRIAMTGSRGISIRPSPTLSEDMMYLALPVKHQGNLIAVIRTSKPLNEIRRDLGAIFIRIAGAGLLAAVVSGLFAMWVVRRLNRPIRMLIDGTARFADGDLEYRLSGFETREMTRLADALNRMASDLHERVQTVIRQRNELEAVLFNMVESVIVVDRNERIVRMNQAARDLFGIREAVPEHRTIGEVIRNSDLLELVRTIFETGISKESSMVIYNEPDRHLQVHGTPLKDESGGLFGVLIVMHDITRMQQLENLRREFVANVSHELKTPITSIKGFIETLREGAIEDRENALRFLDIILDRTNQLNALTDDLLNLSRIEEDRRRDLIPMQKGSIRDVVDSALSLCKFRASEKNITVESSCQIPLEFDFNFQLLEHALVNLLDNAIKYTHSGGRISLTCAVTETEAAVAIRDTGEGIAAEHLDRIFERFYRVDKSRSRKSGGTGLGLSIVKHIVQAHRGTVEVSSEPGKGSVFTIRLPLK
ncbi:PAS domain-containing protein [bacterium]|nr:PAS domain-containing protein [candidate division CSSED10-310 bacterium]